MEKLSSPLTWEDLADEYDKVHYVRKVRTLKMDTVFEWAEKQIYKFKVLNDGTIHKF